MRSARKSQSATCISSRRRLFVRDVAVAEPGRRAEKRAESAVGSTETGRSGQLLADRPRLSPFVVQSAHYKHAIRASQRQAVF